MGIESFARNYQDCSITREVRNVQERAKTEGHFKSPLRIIAEKMIEAGRDGIRSQVNRAEGSGVKLSGNDQSFRPEYAGIVIGSTVITLEEMLIDLKTEPNFDLEAYFDNINQGLKGTPIQLQKTTNLSKIPFDERDVKMINRYARHDPTLSMFLRSTSLLPQPIPLLFDRLVQEGITTKSDLLKATNIYATLAIKVVQDYQPSAEEVEKFENILGDTKIEI